VTTPQPFTHATRASARVALVTCAERPDLEDDDRLVIAPLAARGVYAEPVMWDDPRVDWAGYDLAVLRSTWDYADRRDAFVAWARGVPRLANRAEVVAWNTDKRYLAELADAGLPVVPTRWLAPGAGTWAPPLDGQVVVKPVVSVGSKDTGRYDLADRAQRRLATEHVERLHRAGRLVMVQPYLDAVDTAGETALMFLGGRYSHAVRKGPMLDGPDPGDVGLYKPEQIAPRAAGPDEVAVAERVLAAVPGELLYARVDLIPGPDGAPLVVELELTEPSLYLGYAPGAVDRFAAAIHRSVDGRDRRPFAARR
jgi:glutathione synthase/RimK-type ligase-like ATP-grasp enzyme